MWNEKELNNKAFGGENREITEITDSELCFYFSGEIGKRLSTWVGPKTPNTTEEMWGGKKRWNLGKGAKRRAEPELKRSWIIKLFWVENRGHQLKSLTLSCGLFFFFFTLFGETWGKSWNPWEEAEEEELHLRWRIKLFGGGNSWNHWLCVACFFFFNFSGELGKSWNTWVGSKNPHEELGEQKVKSQQRCWEKSWTWAEEELSNKAFGGGNTG